MSGLFGARSRSPCIKVMWSCGHVYCRRCIAESLKRYSMCPFCSCTLYSNGVVGLSKLPDEEKSDSFRGYYALSVKCSECRWKGEMSQIKTHSNPITNEHCGTGGLSRIINMDEKTGCKADNVVQWLDECKPGNISRFMWLKHQILNPGAIATNHMFNAGMQHHSIVVEFENVPHSKMPPKNCQLTYCLMSFLLVIGSGMMEPPSILRLYTYIWRQYQITTLYCGKSREIFQNRNTLNGYADCLEYTGHNVYRTRFKNTV
eukprot:GHVO01039623.1.p1 GENE.GHVO01039623.1~~GHVO01039623.1.p1  ORF type:complete len:260 (+),score=9.36 GHVO01039623.1:704-1483(+)